MQAHTRGIIAIPPDNYVGPLDGLTNLVAAHGLRRLLSSYTGPLIQVRASPFDVADPTLDVYGNSISESAILSYLTGLGKTAANITRVYDQTDQGRDLVPRADTYVDTDAWQIATGSAINKFNGKPFATIRLATSGMYADTGSDISSTTLWGSMVSNTTASPTGNRFMGISNTSKSTVDADAASRAIMLIRSGDSASVSPTWFRNGVAGNAISLGSHGNRRPMACRFNSTQGRVSTSEGVGTASASTGTFSIRYLLAFCEAANGGSAMSSALGVLGTFTEMFWSTANPSDAEVAAVLAEQKSYYGTT